MHHTHARRAVRMIASPICSNFSLQQQHLHHRHSNGPGRQVIVNEVVSKSKVSTVSKAKPFFSSSQPSEGPRH